MKYLLKKDKEDKGILCEKVTIDGFDYYVSNTKITELKPDDKYATIVENPRRIVFYTKYIHSKDNVVIATNNLNIDIPKVVDEVEKLAYNWLKEKRLKENSIAYTPFKEGYNKSQETHPFSEEDMIEFAWWCLRQDITSRGEGKYVTDKGKIVTTKELLQIWKEQQVKIIYYQN